MTTTPKKPRQIYLVYNRGIVDFISPSLSHAKELASDPENGSKPYMIHKWVLKRGKYEYEKRIQ